MAAAALTLVDVLKRTETFLRDRGVDTPRLDAELLLGKVLGLERVALYLQFDRPFSDDELARLRPLVARRGRREPMAWILGTRGFHALELHTHPGVLVPRPDTETLVDTFLELVPESEDPIYVADVGCGTGAIGLAIAAARPAVRVYAVDREPAALANARANVAATELGQRVAVLRGDLLDAVPAARPIDWVVSNPPYVPTADLDGLMPEVSRHEPRSALDGGADGLDVYRRLVPQCAARARVGVLLEVGIRQSRAVSDLLAASGFVRLQARKDLGGITRVVGGWRPQAV